MLNSEIAPHFGLKLGFLEMQSAQNASVNGFLHAIRLGIPLRDRGIHKLDLILLIGFADTLGEGPTRAQNPWVRLCSVKCPQISAWCLSPCKFISSVGNQQ